MLRAAVEGFEEGWAAAVASGHPAPGEASAGILAVTVLTSDRDASAELLAARASLAARTGCLGVVCAARDLPVVRSGGTGTAHRRSRHPAARDRLSDDQARVAEPASGDRRRRRPARDRQDRDRASDPENAASRLGPSRRRMPVSRTGPSQRDEQTIGHQ